MSGERYTDELGTGAVAQVTERAHRVTELAERLGWGGLQGKAF